MRNSEFRWKQAATKLSSEISFSSKIASHNPAKASFMYEQWIPTVDIFFKGPNYRLFGLLFKHLSRTAILTQASVIVKKIFRGNF